MYKLPNRLRLHSAQAVTLRASVHIQADVLESFIGGLYVEQGLEAVRRWLDPLFRPYAECAYKLVREEHGLPPFPTPSPSPGPPTQPSRAGSTDPRTPSTTDGHLSYFNQQLQKSDRQFEWIYSNTPDGGDAAQTSAPKGTKTTPVWYAKVIVDGELYGHGRGITKKAARNEAAKIGLKTMGIFV